MQPLNAGSPSSSGEQLDQNGSNSSTEMVMFHFNMTYVTDRRHAKLQIKLFMVLGMGHYRRRTHRHKAAVLIIVSIKGNLIV